MTVTAKARACAVPPDVWARRMAQAGAPPELGIIAPPEDGQPWRPWASPVMAFASADHGADNGPNLWLACCECGWLLGYSVTCSPGYLAEQAAVHRRDHCDESAAYSRKFYSEGQGASVTSYALAADGTWQLAERAAEPKGARDE